jgi:hypothetical protein
VQTWRAIDPPMCDSGCVVGPPEVILQDSSDQFRPLETCSMDLRSKTDNTSTVFEVNRTGRGCSYRDLVYEPDALSFRNGVSHGENYRVLRAQQLPEKGNQVDSARTTGETYSVRLRGSTLRAEFTRCAMASGEGTRNVGSGVRWSRTTSRG